jgi:Zn finger protein HypA/HybF involved in hydrogenase expression
MVKITCVNCSKVMEEEEKAFFCNKCLENIEEDYQNLIDEE